MAVTVVLVAFCSLGVAFLLYVLHALQRETRTLPNSRYPRVGGSRVVVQLAPGPIFTAETLRPLGIGENVPFAIAPRPGGSAAEFCLEDSQHKTVSIEGGRFRRSKARAHAR